MDKVNFVALNEGVILVKFGNTNDRTRILNLTPWLFDQCLFVIPPFVAIDMEKVIREVMEIDWRDKDGGWTGYIRIRVKIDVLRPLRRVVHLVGSEGIETVCPINSEGHSGGLAMLWKDGVNLTIQNYSSHHIDSLVCMESHNNIRFMGFYGHADPNLRSRPWDILRMVRISVREDWIVGGDFNAMTYEAEKEGTN
ncbi:hypothetical protein Goklo_024626 [Gossypium klotzschianum]|uniref:Endonuclease/exonuclease/phosphatase domain-containing protein n=1 Tax=Gossypium klotzschianum TaxID=34286 RepID=A0A7J8WAW2_9ROSI|nr:hypothetical protein [Gossypium klotzschianum]